jgi:N-acetylmuramoyl-L-alanine amidase
MMIKKEAVKLFLILLCSTAALQLRGQATFRVFEKPVIFDAERKQLSLEYLEKRHGLKQNDPIIKPLMIVLHWTAVPTIEQTFDVFNKSRLPGARKEIATASALNVSFAIPGRQGWDDLPAAAGYGICQACDWP